MSRTLLLRILFLLPLLVLGACGGGGGGTPPAEEPPAFVPTVLESTATTFRASVRFGAPTFTTRAEAGQTFTEVALEGCHPSGASDGGPGVPILTRLLAVPQGARVVVSNVTPVVSQTLTLLLHPFQARAGDYSPAYDLPGPVAPEERDWVPPFVYDASAYGGAAAVPPNPIVISPVTMARDVRMVVLQIAAGRYVPATRELTLYASVGFTLSFEGATGPFLPNAARNPFDQGSQTALGAAWNHAAAEGFVPYVPPGGYVAYGEELLILTHPDYRAAADRLAEHKNAIGILTSVVTVNDGAAAGGPDTKEEIKAILDNRYATALVRYSYLLLFGDADDIEPWVLPRRYVDGYDFPSDFPYAQVNTDALADDLYPAVAVGRLAVNDPAQAEVVVDKIIQYETSPPVVLPGGPFYGYAAIASYFQPGEGGADPNVENYRQFIYDSEEIRGHLVSHGFQVQRIYTADHPLTDDTTPRYYEDGVTTLPPPLRPEDGYPWDGDAAKIAAAFNAGKSLFFHVDHGGSKGWGEPHFVTSDLPSLTNGDLLPLVLSDNCTSGAFDFVDAGFAESIVRMSGGGAIAAMAFTRGSNNGVGKDFVVGVVDALWPDAYPGYGDGITRHRLGDMLNHARGLMVIGFVGGSPADAGYLVAWCYTRMLTLFGDPTLSVWMENPLRLPNLGDELVAGPKIELIYPLRGATITVFEEVGGAMVPIGRGMAGEGGAVSIDPIVTPTDVNHLHFFASSQGAVPTEVTVTSAGP